jgi:uncharacterized protein (TIGR00369 family)
MIETIRAPKTTQHLEQLRSMARGELPPPAVAVLVGFRLVEVELGQAVTEMETAARHANPMGTLHGGIVCDLGDAAIGCAMASTLEDGESFTTVDLTAKYFKPIWAAHLRAVARLTRRTRTLGLLECDVTDGGGSLVAKLFSTCMVLRGQEASGR